MRRRLGKLRPSHARNRTILVAACADVRAANALSPDIRADAAMSYGRLELRAFAASENAAKLDQTSYDDVRCYWAPGTYQLLGIEAGETFTHPTGIRTASATAIVFSKSEMTLEADEYPEDIYYTAAGVVSTFGTRPASAEDQTEPLPTVSSEALLRIPAARPILAPCDRRACPSPVLPTTRPWATTSLGATNGAAPSRARRSPRSQPTRKSFSGAGRRPSPDSSVAARGRRRA